MNDEDVVKKSAALTAKNDHTNKPSMTAEAQPDFTSDTLPRIELAEEAESNLKTNGDNNTHDGLDDVLWPPFC